VSVVTDQTIEDWRAEKSVLEHDIATKQERLACLNARLRRGADLIGEEFPVERPQPDFGSSMPLAGRRLSIIEAIEKIANSRGKPISKAELREHLSALGLARGNFNNYFYTAIRRLKRRRQITVLEDGGLWRAPSEE
jgi:hypothetical protein